MRRVVVESPYASSTEEGIQKNIAYARACVKDCLDRGESPVAFHLLHTQPGILDDSIPEQRNLGIEAGLWWTRVAETVAVYADLGISTGMRRGIEAATLWNIPVEYRTLEGGKHG